MTTVFIAGSITIKRLDPRFVDRIRNIVEDNFDVVVGDANGADTSIQNELHSQLAKNVTVYCSGSDPRNNIGSWKTRVVRSTARPGTRAYFAAKDKAMAEDADYGLMLWNASSPGTLSNVIELIRGGKKCVVFINKSREFINVKRPDDLSTLISVMSQGAITQANKKIGLSRTISELAHPQSGLPL